MCGSEIGVKDQYRGEAPSVGVPEALYLGSVQECQQLPCERRSQTSAHICVRDVVRALGTAYAVAVMVYRLCSAYRAGGFPVFALHGLPGGHSEGEELQPLAEISDTGYEEYVDWTLQPSTTKLVANENDYTMSCIGAAQRR